MTISDILKLQRLNLPNFTQNGPLGTAAATVDTAAAFSIEQTTANITVTLPRPTVDFDANFLVVQNIGNVSITIDSTKVKAGEYMLFSFAFNKWLPITGTGAATGATDGLKKFYVQGALTNGENLITHNLGLTTPKAYHLQMTDEQTGAQVFARVKEEAENSLKIVTVSTTATVNITIIG